MKSIVVKTKGSVSCYSSGHGFSCNDDGTKTPIEYSEEEETQMCYQSLIDDIKRKQFDINLKNFVLSYLGYDEKDVENIKIIVDRIKGGHCEMNIRVTDDWSKAISMNIEMPEKSQP